ncbi:apolipoprotein N-acyltransferase [Oceaniglobus ichthyenteri]|uniref:apolipoprotein N-acyltransferase n=1 Tax=Oceaniglobus ichthyenteri TaxID=2136177 RepID=UPI001F0BF306|nr:apolipoprotein N-acyltransferase [Oceaniglobus ichthyenteri]
MSKLHGWRLWAVCLGAGAMAALGQVPFSLVPVALIALAFCCALFMTAANWRRAALIGWICGAGYFAVTLHWIVEPFLVDAPRHGWMAPFALIFSAFGFSLFWAFGFGLAHGIARPGWCRAVAWAVAMTMGEMLRGYILTGFPWAMLGYIWSEGRGAQIVAVIGPYGLTLVTLLGVAIAAHLDRRRSAALVLVGLWGWIIGTGHLLLDPAQPAPADAATLRLVQPNAPQNEKWDPDRAMVFFNRQLDYTAAPGAPDLTIWPETAIPWLAEPGHPALEQIAFAAQDRPVIIGAQRLEGFRAFNSLLRLGVGGEINATYDKHHLVPLGEYIPFGQVTSWMGLQSFAAQDGYGFSAGPGPELLDLGPLGRTLPLICYEAVFPQDLRGTARPDWIVQITNDAWFGTFAGPQQHLAQARLRAIEQGLPLVRVANTGISGLIDARGRLRDHIPLGQAGYIDVRLPKARAATPYSKTGDLPLALLLCVFAAALLPGRSAKVIDP